VSTNQLFLAVSVTVFLVTAARFAGWTVAFIGSYLITLCGLTTVLYLMDGSVGHVGIAPSAPMIFLGDLLLLGALISIWAGGGRLDIGWLLVAFGIPAVFLLLAVWGNTPEQWAGLKLYLTAILSFGVGRWLSENLTDRRACVLACACFMICAIQFIVTFAQWMGINEFAYRSYSSATKAIIATQGRMVGLYEHPGSLGKTMLLLFCFLLPLSVRPLAVTRRLAYAAIAMAVFATLLTLSRANSFAIIVALILWPILRGKVNETVKILGAAAAIGTIVAVNTSIVSDLFLRFDDRSGGPRGHLMEIGMQQIWTAPLTGTGPNYYTEVVGQYDSLAAEGLPVHNALMLATAELGLPLAVVLFACPAIAVLHAVRRIFRDKAIDSQSAALLSVLPGIAVAGWTGWGLMATEALPLWFMAFGFLSSRRQEVRFVRGKADRYESVPSDAQPYPLRA
jgi:hypothetical protein